jgi:ElaB/YqjD/DUF883 family membrane-anchored ribosome-binding protein
MVEISTAQMDRLQNDLRAVIADAEGLLGSTAGQVGEWATEALHRIQARLQQVKANLAHLKHGAVTQAKAAGRAADECVHDNPWQAIGAAAGIGLLVGVLIGRR